jgi:cytochrome o ubiquinol oxidase subunit 1
MTWSPLLGTLDWSALPSDPVAIGGGIFMGVLAVLGVGAVTYGGWWGYLWREWFTSLDPKRIGIMYIVLSLVMLVRGTADAGLMRLQQALAAGQSNGILEPEHFQQIFTAHGTIMIFFVAMGVLFGLINVVLPLLIGSRDVAFPFLNSMSFWLFAAGAMLVNTSLVLGDFSRAGWLAYPPLSELAYSPTTGVDYWIWSLQISGLGSLLSGVNFVTTIATMRAKGMTYMKMPMFVWTVLGSMTLLLFVFPILTASLSLLALDRSLGMHFFTADFGGNMMMYVNLIWAWGHPEVYILVLPAFGIFSEIVPVFSKKRLAGYTSMVWSVVVITFLSFLVWLHHFFTMGAGGDVNAFFGIMTGVIAVPTGVKVFNWLFTMYRGSIRFPSPMLWFMGFVVLFLVGGVTGVMLSQPVADFQFHNSLFLVAHFHNMVVSGVLFGYFAGLTYWFPKMFGFCLDEKWGRRAFWLWFWGFLVAFMPLYLLGFMGATRRLDHYDASLGWQPLFVIAAIGAVIIVLGFLAQVIQLVVSIMHRKQLKAGNDPWDGRTLEWSVSSPAPEYNFAALPVVTERDEFWERKNGVAGTDEPDAIIMPRNSALGIVIGGCAFTASFAIIWHIWWLLFVALLALLAVVLARTFAEDTEHVISL